MQIFETPVNSTSPPETVSRYRKRSAALMGGGMAVASVLMAGCGSGNVAANKTVTQGTSEGSQNSIPSPSATLTFDALGGGSNYIQVYPGPEASTSDGVFEAGQNVGVICETKGRPVQSDPKVGETYVSSQEWYEIEAGGKTYFATAVYADIHGKPDTCKPSQLP